MVHDVADRVRLDVGTFTAADLNLLLVDIRRGYRQKPDGHAVEAESGMSAPDPTRRNLLVA
jgi:hypothetical protein